MPGERWGRRGLALWLAGWAAAAAADIGFRNLDDPDAPRWQEEAVEPPAYPQAANLLPFYVSEMTAHRFFIDGSTLSVGKDGVVRYVLVVQTSGGATNVSFEGIRCETREFRIYATGRHDGSWAKARVSPWRPIENKPMNRHHAALSRDLFCPSGAPIATPAEGREALKRGKHPNAA
ncbi:MAG: CNP1-like family protein [Rhodocyclaceae bacterium]|nr:CNP1-like family protein [Rhodocyclaceae bacterium]